MIERRVITISLEQLEDVLASHLHALGVLRRSEDVLSLEIPGVEVSDDGTIDLECEITFVLR